MPRGKFMMFSAQELTGLKIDLSWLGRRLVEPIDVLQQTALWEKVVTMMESDGPSRPIRPKNCHRTPARCPGQPRIVRRHGVGRGRFSETHRN